jgi:hypothetical protein
MFQPKMAIKFLKSSSYKQIAVFAIIISIKHATVVLSLFHAIIYHSACVEISVSRLFTNSVVCASICEETPT